MAPLVPGGSLGKAGQRRWPGSRPEGGKDGRRGSGGVEKRMPAAVGPVSAGE
jgi:hypothetical protein